MCYTVLYIPCGFQPCVVWHKFSGFSINLAGLTEEPAGSRHSSSNYATCTALLLSKSGARSCHVKIL